MSRRPIIGVDFFHAVMAQPSEPRRRRSIAQANDQADQTGISRHAQGRQDDDDIAAGAEALPAATVVADFAEELAVPLLAAQQGDDQHAGAVDGEQGADAVEFRREDLEHHEGEGELRERGPDVGAFEGALQRTDFDQFGGGEDDGAGAVQAEVVLVGLGLEHSGE